MNIKKCKCGCGKDIPSVDRRGRERFYAAGHTHKGKIFSIEYRKKISVGHVGINKGSKHPMFGKHHSEEALKKMSLVHKGKPVWNTGKKMTKSFGEKISNSKIGRFRGKDSPHWIKDRSKIKTYDNRRDDSNYKIWRKKVYERDNFKCKIDNKDCKGRIEAHHICGWTEFPELRYDINNGITLCHKHHPQGKKQNQLIPFLKSLLK